MSCKNCARLNRSRVLYDKNTKYYRYGCGKFPIHEDSYVPVWCKDDGDLSTTGCSGFISKKNIVVSPGDIIYFKKDGKKMKYLYCGVVNKKRLIYGGEINGKTYMLSSFHLIDMNDKTFINKKDVVVVSGYEGFAKQKMKEFYKKECVKS